MDRHEAAAKKAIDACEMCKCDACRNALVVALREQFPERGHGERLRDAILKWGAEHVAYRINSENLEDLIDTLERHGFFAEPEPERGRCGECRQRPPEPLSSGCGKQPSFYCHERSSYMACDMSCPRFVRREDKAARLGRELAVIAQTNCVTTLGKRFEDHLRANGVGEE